MTITNLKQQKNALTEMLSIYGNYSTKSLKSINKEQAVKVNKHFIIKHFDVYWQEFNNEKAKAFIGYNDILENAKAIVKNGAIEEMKNEYLNNYVLSDEQEDQVYKLYNKLTKLIIKNVKVDKFEQLQVQALKEYYRSIANVDGSKPINETRKAFEVAIIELIGVSEECSKDIADKLEINAIGTFKVKSEYGLIHTLYQIVKTVLIKHGQYSEKKSILEYKRCSKEIDIIHEFEWNTSNVTSYCDIYGIKYEKGKNYDYRVVKRALKTYLNTHAVILPKCLFSENLVPKEQPKEEKPKAPKYTKEIVEKANKKTLQALCKENGLKCNGKVEELKIRLLENLTNNK